MSDFDNRIARRNRAARAQWAQRWYDRGGGPGWPARDMQDVRNEVDMHNWRELEFKLSKARASLWLKKIRADRKARANVTPIRRKA